MSDKSEACPVCGTPVDADVEEINKPTVEEQPKPENPIPNEQLMDTKGETSPAPAENNTSTATPPPPITSSDKPTKKSNKTPLIIGIAAAVVVIAAAVVLFFMKGNKDDKTPEEPFVVEQQDPNEAELSNLVLDAYKTHEIYNLETSDFQAARKAATAAEEASGLICIDRDYYYCTQDDYPNRFDVTRVDFINPNKANVYVELIFDREVFNREGNYFTDNVVLTMVRNSGSVWLVDDVWHGGNSIKQEMIECTRDIQNEIMSNTSSNVAKVSSNAYEGNQVVVIDGSELRLRLSPSTSSDTFKWPDGTNRHPKVGERFKYLGESGDFYKIDFNGNELWVSKQFSHIE